MDKFLTDTALAAYSEEFEYYAAEAPDCAIDLCVELFTENHGEDEARKIDWDFVGAKILSKMWVK